MNPYINSAQDAVPGAVPVTKSGLEDAREHAERMLRHCESQFQEAVSSAGQDAEWDFSDGMRDYCPKFAAAWTLAWAPGDPNDKPSHEL